METRNSPEMLTALYQENPTVQGIIQRGRERFGEMDIPAIKQALLEEISVGENPSV